MPPLLKIIKLENPCTFPESIKPVLNNQLNSIRQL